MKVSTFELQEVSRKSELENRMMFITSLEVFNAAGLTIIYNISPFNVSEILMKILHQFSMLNKEK